MSDTPETNAAISDGAEMLTNQSDSVALYQKLCDAVCEIQGLKCERDEARQAFIIATDQMVIAQGKLREANKERDEAREQRDRLAEIAKQFVSILDITEQSDGGRLFHPTNITSCRAGDLQKIGELVEALRRASKTDRIIRNAEIAELDRLKEGVE
jgi:predicted house-cleaning NTP pyrophosphatase (Maf/HAM1 superfamily)